VVSPGLQLLKRHQPAAVRRKSFQDNAIRIRDAPYPATKPVGLIFVPDCDSRDTHSVTVARAIPDTNRICQRVLIDQTPMIL
jgi:hypothetical protein